METGEEIATVGISLGEIAAIWIEKSKSLLQHRAAIQILLQSFPKLQCLTSLRKTGGDLGKLLQVHKHTTMPWESSTKLHFSIALHLGKMTCVQTAQQ